MTRVVFGAALALAACNSGHRAPVEPGPAPIDEARRTTSGAIALGNLDAQIEAAERRSSAARVRVRLVELLLTRAQLRGTYGDLDRALALADTYVAESPGPDAWQLRARVYGALHEFERARADLARAAEAGADVADEMASLDLAVGRNLDQVLERRRQAALDAPSFRTLSALAAAQTAVGRFEEADASYLAAVEHYRDVSPFAVAWVDFQRGVTWSEHAARPEWAPPLYESAVRRLPGYVVANVHLAELEAERDAAAAVARLRPIAATTEDPEPSAVMGELLASIDPEASTEAIDAARAGYERLLARWPLAFADHAAEFFMGPGGDPARALQLAELNLSNRTTDRAWELAISAAVAAGDRQRACTWADEAGVDRPSVPLRRLLEETRAGCLER